MQWQPLCDTKNLHLATFTVSMGQRTQCRGGAEIGEPWLRVILVDKDDDSEIECHFDNRPAQW